MQMMRLRFHALFDPLLLYFLVQIANYSLLLGKPQTRQDKKTIHRNETRKKKRHKRWIIMCRVSIILLCVRIHVTSNQLQKANRKLKSEPIPITGQNCDLDWKALPTGRHPFAHFVVSDKFGWHDIISGRLGNVTCKNNHLLIETVSGLLKNLNWFIRLFLAYSQISLGAVVNTIKYMYFNSTLQANMPYKI